MRVIAKVHVLGKVSRPWKDRDGVNRVTNIANVSQNNGEIVDSIRLTQEQFDSVVSGKDYTVTADYGTSINGNYLRIMDIAEIK